MIPYTTGGKLKVLEMHPYTGVTLRMPGRHGVDSNGGDFVICVDSERLDWTQHQFTHTDIFMDLEQKTNAESDSANCLMGMYYELIVNGLDPEPMIVPGGERLPGLHYRTFLYATQCLAVAEHRRYEQHEAKWGGRYLPLRFSLGIAEGLWTAAHAAEKQKYGRPGVQQLERTHGMPTLTEKLMA